MVCSEYQDIHFHFLPQGNIRMNFFGIVILGIAIPFPNSFFNPISSSADAAPVANAGATFETPRIA